jgi:hypothetical protein
VIQSAAEGIGQSEVFERAFDDAPDFDGLVDVADDESPAPAAAGTAVSPASDDESDFSGEGPSVEPSSLLPAVEPDRAAVRRSFLAQPDPL